MNKYNVIYSYSTTFEAQVEARSKKEAVSKVREVIGNPVIESVYLLRGER